MSRRHAHRGKRADVRKMLLDGLFSRHFSDHLERLEHEEEGGSPVRRRRRKRRASGEDDDGGTGRRRRRRGGAGGGGRSRGGPFGGRRPLRYLSRKLDLTDEQFREMTAMFSQLKTERAQMAVDRRRGSALYAEALEAATFDKDKAAEAARISASTQARFDAFIGQAIARLHELLDEGQRARMAVMLREMPLSRRG